MKKIILLTISIVFLNAVIAQDNKSFQYTKSEYGSYLVTPVSNSKKREGTRGFPEWRDDKYIAKLLYSTVRQVIPKEKFEKMQRSSMFFLTFNKKGEILNCTFVLQPEDISLVTEKELLDIYQGFLKKKINMRKVSIKRTEYTPIGKEVDYAEIGGSLVPLEYRKK